MEDLIKYIQDLLGALGYHDLAKYAGLIITITGIVTGSLIPFLWKFFRWTFKYLQQRKLTKDLHPFYTQIEIKKATQYYVPTKCQNIAPSKENEPRQTHAFATKEECIPFFIKKAFKTDKEDYRFYFVLADSGMGKTTFLINLYLKYISQLFGKEYKIKLLPLGFPDIDKELDKMEDSEKEKTILLLDAFDEDNEAVIDYRSRLTNLMKKVWRFREVVITCRTQFFPSEEEEPKETGVLRFGVDRGEHVFRKLYISPFDDRDINLYLSKKFSIFQHKSKKKAKQIVDQSPNLMVRPMLLSYIDDLLQSKRHYEYTFMIYQELIEKWIVREANRMTLDRQKRYRLELYNFSRAIALDMYRNRKERDGLYIKGIDIKPFAKKHQIELMEMDIKSRSLLNRNARGEYKFSHKSILEYFLAAEAFNDREFREELNSEGMEQAKIFYDDFNEFYWNKFTVPYFRQNNLKGSFEVEAGVRRNINMIEPKLVFKLKVLTLEDSDELDLVVLKQSSNLESLTVNNIKLKGLEWVKEFTHLDWLQFDNNQISDISPLKELKNLRHLLLPNNGIADISTLKTLKNLRYLVLSNNQITDIGALHELRSLEELELSNNPINSSQIETLRHTLPNCRIFCNCTVISNTLSTDELVNNKAVLTKLPDDAENARIKIQRSWPRG